jgi:hypothetical protein
MNNFLTKLAPSTSRFDRSRSIKKIERRSHSSLKRYDDSPEKPSNSTPYRSRDSKGCDPSSKDPKRRSSSPYYRNDKSLSRRHRSSSLRILINNPQYPDSGSLNPLFRKPKLREARSEMQSEKYNGKKDDILYVYRERYRGKEMRECLDDDRCYDEDDGNLKEDSGCRRDDFEDDRRRKEDSKSNLRISRTTPNLSRRSSNFRMQLYHSLNVVDRTKVKIHSRSRNLDMSKQESLQDTAPRYKVSYSFPQKINRLERSEPIAMCPAKICDDDGLDYSHGRHERKIHESSCGRSDDEEIFALDIEPLPNLSNKTE